MPFSTVLQLHLPDSFPLKAFEIFVEAVKSAIPGVSDARSEFGGASNIIGWRFRSCVEDKEAYMASWRKYGADSSFDEIYRRERLLFGVFVSGVSCIEAAAYACYALASSPAILNLPFDEKIRRYQSSPKHLLTQMKTAKHNANLTLALEELISSQEWSLWTGFRNTMTHRSNIPRIIYAAMGSLPPIANPLEFTQTWSSKALAGDETSFNAMIEWLAESLEGILDGGTELTHLA